MGTLVVKDARMELKTTGDAKDLLSKAAVLSGMDLSSFMISCSMPVAKNVIRDHASIALSAEGQAKLANLLQSKPAQTKDMKKLRSLSRLEVRE
jgi:uncharacterized protein (DUF1778 family)